MTPADPPLPPNMEFSIIYRKNVLKLRTQKPKQFFKSIKKMIDPEKGEELLEVDEIRHLSDVEQVELIADKFSEVSCEYQPINRDKISFPPFQDLTILSESDVLEVLLNLDTSKTTRQNDVPAKIYKKFAHQLHKPLTLLINMAIKEGCWPDFLKLEIVTPIPKINDPKNIDDLRNISGLMNLNKIMEKLICKLILVI